MVVGMRKPLAVLLSLLFVASLAACSDDDAGPDAASGSGSGTEEPSAGDGSDDATTTTGDDEGDDDVTTTTGDDSGDDAGPASEEYCAVADRFVSDESLANLDMTDPDDVAIGVALLEELRDAAPDDIQDDIQVIIDVFQEVAVAAAEAGDDPEAQAAISEEFQEEIAALDEATTVLTEFTLDECGIDITGGGATGTP